MRSARLPRTQHLATLAVIGIACSSPTDGARPPVGTVELAPPSATLSLGASFPFQATVKDADGNVLTGRQIFWASNDTTVATVSSTGVVSAVRIGTAQVAASSEGVYAIAAIAVTPVPVASVAVIPASTQVRVRRTVQLEAAAYDASGELLTGRAALWSTDDPLVATVDAAGLVTGVAPGTVAISATIEGKTASSTVRVTPPPVGSVTVSPLSAELEVGRTLQLAAVVRDDGGQILPDASVAWRSSDANVAAVSGNGLVTAVAEGNATITATSGDESGSASIRVMPEAAASVTIAPDEVTLVVGQSATLEATPRDGDGNPLPGRPVTWSSSNPLIASVDGDGEVQALVPGDATITARSGDASGTAVVHVRLAPVAQVIVEPERVELEEGDTVQLRARTYDALGRELIGRGIVWSSSDQRIAGVNGEGRVRAEREGIATITAESEGVTDTALIIVQDD